MTARSLLLGLLLLTPALHGHAASFECIGTITQVQTSATGEVRILPTWRNDLVTLCNAITPWKGIPIEVCKRWHAHVLTAQLAQSNSRVYYATATATSCSTMGINNTADAPDQVGNN